MLDIKAIRENPADFINGFTLRGIPEPEKRVLEILETDSLRRKNQTFLQEQQTRLNGLSAEIGAAMRTKDVAAAMRLKEEVAGVKVILHNNEDLERELEAKLSHALTTLPNIPDPSVPFGKTEEDNVLERTATLARPAFAFTPKQHFEIGEALGLFDVETATKMAGSRFSILKGPLAKLERALGQFMIDLHTEEHGYTEYQVPLLVRGEALFGTGQLPKFEDDLFKTIDDRYLIPTAEVSLTNVVADSILDINHLPMRMTALTPCFRAEAGAAGRDVRGMLRQHQFNKVELVSVVEGDEMVGKVELQRMTECATNVLDKLKLHYRVVRLCSGDMGFGAKLTFDIEVWMPGQNTYREISSCSLCGDFQARRMKARYKSGEEKGTRFVHTLNGSGVAVGRALIAVMENYQNEDGSITVPEVLRPYMGGLQRIAAN